MGDACSRWGFGGDGEVAWWIVKHEMEVKGMLKVSLLVPWKKTPEDGLRNEVNDAIGGALFESQSDKGRGKRYYRGSKSGCAGQSMR